MPAIFQRSLAIPVAIWQTVNDGASSVGEFSVAEFEGLGMPTEEADGNELFCEPASDDTQPLLSVLGTRRHVWKRDKATDGLLCICCEVQFTVPATL